MLEASNVKVRMTNIQTANSENEYQTKFWRPFIMMTIAISIKSIWIEDGSQILPDPIPNVTPQILEHIPRTYFITVKKIRQIHWKTSIVTPPMLSLHSQTKKSGRFPQMDYKIIHVRDIQIMSEMNPYYYTRMNQKIKIPDIPVCKKLNILDPNCQISCHLIQYFFYPSNLCHVNYQGIRHPNNTTRFHLYFRNL